MEQPTAAAGNLTEYSVSEIAFALKRTLETAFGLVRVRGEISGFKRAASGHLYMALKDDKAVLDAVCWRTTALRLPFKPEDGLEVTATGRITTYPGRSRYQIVIDSLEPAGVGALMALFEQRKKALEAEGLFAPERKRPLPFLPATIGIVTSPTGAVIRDMLHRLTERFPRHVILWPVPVQGEGAAERIAEAVTGFDRFARDGRIARPDLLIVARGGGSIEDLWAFNEEVVARAVAASSIPVISAVGHETDTTLIDYVADCRAPTPTAAAELAVPVRSELLLTLDDLASRHGHALTRHIQELRRHVDGLARGLPDPVTVLRMAEQRLDDLGERLRLRTPGDVVREKSERLAARFERLIEITGDRLRREARALDNLPPERLEHAVGRRLVELTAALDACGKLLESMSHRRVLERGYALVHDPDGTLVTSREAASARERLALEFADGRLTVLPERAPRGRRRQSAPVQEELL